MKDLEKYLDTIGEKGYLKRLEVIASMDLGKRSEAAKRAVNKRYAIKELMQKGLSFEDSLLIVNKRLNENN